MFRFDRLSLKDLAELCTRVSASTRSSVTMEDAATAVVRCMRDLFGVRRTGRSDIVLARAFQTVRYDVLPPELREYVDQRLRPDEPRPQRCLVLLGTDGDLPEWCDRTKSVDHQALPLSSVEALSSTPMVSALVDHLGINVQTFLTGDQAPDVESTTEDFRVFFVPQALNSPEVPAQGFVQNHGVVSVLGFGGLLPNGDVFSIVLFTRAVISEDVAELFRTVSVAAKLALLGTASAPLFSGQPPRPVDLNALASARLRGLEQMLEVQQKTVTDQATRLEGALEDAVVARNEAEREAAATELLREVTTMLSAELDIDRLVQAATDAATRISGAAYGAFFYNVVRDGERYMLYTLSGIELSAFEKFPMPRPTQIFRPTFEGTRIIRSADIRKEPEYGQNAPYFGMPEGHPPVRSHLAVPVISRSGEVHGGFFFGHPEVGVFDDRVERLVVGIAAQTAIALDNARLYQAERETALALQKSLLPQEVRAPDGLEVGYEYLAGGEGVDVGGDWYDVIPLSAGRTAFVIGDVMGKGIRAAAVMGQLRTAIRAYAISDLPPDVLTSRLNRLVVGLGEDLIATCVYAVLDQTTDRLTIASAGHPPPGLVSPDGSVSLPDLSLGPPLGIPGTVHTQHELDFPAGSQMVLFTDGLVEHRGRLIGAGLEALAARLRDLEGPAQVVCKELIASLVDDESQDDDITVLMVSNTGLSRQELASRRFPPDFTAAAKAREFVRAVLTEWGDTELVQNVTAAVNEAFVNALAHAGTDITLRLQRLPQLLVAEVEDHSGIHPRRTQAQPDDENNRGLEIVEGLATRWGSRPTDSGKIVWLEFGLRDGPTSG